MDCLKFKDNVAKVNCKKETLIQSPESFRAISKDAQQVMFEDYTSLIISPKQRIKCLSLRSIFQSCYPDLIKKEGKKEFWDSYSSPSIYELISDMFPKLKIKNYPYYNSRGVKLSSKETPETSSFLFIDYISPDRTQSQIVGWGNYNNDIIVFRNGGIPSIKYFDNLEPEETEEGIVVKKERKFGEFILFNKYELVGVLILEGNTIGVHGGVHYLSYIKTENKDCEWLKYNDMAKEWDCIGSLPSSVFREMPNEKPEMYFYCKK